jgi:hypothetical protein
VSGIGIGTGYWVNMVQGTGYRAQGTWYQVSGVGFRVHLEGELLELLDQWPMILWQEHHKVEQVPTHRIVVEDRSLGRCCRPLLGPEGARGLGGTRWGSGCVGFRGSGFGVQGSRFGVWGSGFGVRVSGLEGADRCDEGIHGLFADVEQNELETGEKVVLKEVGHVL